MQKACHRMMTGFFTHRRAARLLHLVGFVRHAFDQKTAEDVTETTNHHSEFCAEYELFGPAL
jgi:hypothetical protein